MIKTGAEGAQPRLSVIILTFNEEVHIRRCIESVLPVASEVIVVDSFSKDSTLDIARSLGAKVFERPFVNYADQFQWAIDNTVSGCDWIMRLDADEYLERDLQSELESLLGAVPDHVVGINLKLKRIFMGRWIKRGGIYPLTLLRVWRRGFGRIEQRWMDEHIVVENGGVVTASGGLCDYNMKDLSFFTSKHNQYATREAIDAILGKYSDAPVDIASSDLRSSKQAAVTRWIKKNIYYAMPSLLAPIMYFIYRYVIRLGFLDGREGLIYHLLQGLWYRFLVGAKIVEFERKISGLTSIQSVRLTLSELSGYNVK